MRWKEYNINFNFRVSNLCNLRILVTWSSLKLQRSCKTLLAMKLKMQDKHSAFVQNSVLGHSKVPQKIWCTSQFIHGDKSTWTITRLHHQEWYSSPCRYWFHATLKLAWPASPHRISHTHSLGCLTKQVTLQIEVAPHLLVWAQDRPRDHHHEPTKTIESH